MQTIDDLIQYTLDLSRNEPVRESEPGASGSEAERGQASRKDKSVESQSKPGNDGTLEGEPKGILHVFDLVEVGDACMVCVSLECARCVEVM